MLDTICGFLNGCGFVGVRFDVYRLGSYVILVFVDGVMSGWLTLVDDRLSVVHDDIRGGAVTRGGSVDVNDPEFFVKLRVLVEDFVSRVRG